MPYSVQEENRVKKAARFCVETCEEPKDKEVCNYRLVLGRYAESKSLVSSSMLETQSHILQIIIKKQRHFRPVCLTGEKRKDEQELAILCQLWLVACSMQEPSLSTYLGRVPDRLDF